jgi:hypothetical protein
MRHHYDYDIAMVSDFRYPGGNSTSLVEEVKALAAAGYSIALVHLPAEHMKRRRSFNHKIIHCISAGMATLEPVTRSLRVRALIIRQPRVFADELKVAPRIDSEERVLVVNHPPFDGWHPPENPYYRVDEVRGRVEATFGSTQWAPIGPQVRKALHDTGVSVSLPEEDWHNIINVDEWLADRRPLAHGVPVIGRHSRPHPAKWLADPDELLAAYPESDRFEVRILGGADPAIAALGRTPRSWTIHPFGAMRPADFLADIDFFVYFHHPDWIEAFGRNTIEAMASGVPAILPPHFEPLFGEAALYGSPFDVQNLVSSLYADRAAYEERVRRSREFVDDHFGARVHVRRIKQMIGEPTGQSRRRPRITPPPPRRKRVLLIAAESRGLGSVARLLRLAPRLQSEVEPIAVIGVPAVAEVTRAGMLCEYVQFDRPGRRGRREWVAGRIKRIIDRERPGAVLVDGDHIPQTLVDVAAAASVPFVMLMPSTGTFEHRHQHIFSSLLRFTDPISALGRAEANGHSPGGDDVLSIQPFLPAPGPRPAASAGGGPPRTLVALGADTRTVAPGAIGQVVEALRHVGAEPVVARPLVGPPRHEEWAGADSISLDPRGSDLWRFDFAVIAPSVMLVQDAIAARLPFVTVAAGSPGHEGRADLLAERRLAPRLGNSDADISATVRRFTDASQRQAAADRLATIALVDGTGTVATLLEGLLGPQALISSELEVTA